MSKARRERERVESQKGKHPPLRKQLSRPWMSRPQVTRSTFQKIEETLETDNNNNNNNVDENLESAAVYSCAIL